MTWKPVCYMLSRVADLVDDGKLVWTVTGTLGNMTIDIFKDVQAHTKQESGKVIGKIVMDEFQE